MPNISEDTAGGSHGPCMKNSQPISLLQVVTLVYKAPSISCRIDRNSAWLTNGARVYGPNF